MSTSRELTPQQLRDYRDQIKRRPELDEALQLFVKYAKSKGGTTLEVWRLMKGPWFNEPQKLSQEAVAEALNIPVSAVHEIIRETAIAVRPQLRAMRPAVASARQKVLRDAEEYRKQHQDD